MQSLTTLPAQPGFSQLACISTRLQSLRQPMLPLSGVPCRKVLRGYRRSKGMTMQRPRRTRPSPSEPNGRHNAAISSWLQTLAPLRNQAAAGEPRSLPSSSSPCLQPAGALRAAAHRRWNSAPRAGPSAQSFFCPSIDFTSVSLQGVSQSKKTFHSRLSSSVCCFQKTSVKRAYFCSYINE